MASFPYFPHTEGDISAMLERTGVKALDDLYSDVPSKFLHKEPLNLPEAMSEQQVRDFFEKLLAKDAPLAVFAGQGAYDHYTPAVVPYICSRSEFLTAYTPYQCEISQGTLRYIFEFQSMICALTGLDVSNASVYDGPTAAAEAVRMAIASTKGRQLVLLSDALLPHVKRVVATYAKFAHLGIDILPCEGGHTSLEALKAKLEGGLYACAIVPSVNRFGIVEDHTGFAEALHGAGALLVEYCDPSTLAVVKSPAEWGADIAVGDGQSLGIPLNFGGPYVGFMACTKPLMRKLPGRIVGQTTDAAGRRVFVLTLQAREQHIRREKATSNICSNESLMALWVSVYLSLMGPEGLKEVNEKSHAAALYLRSRLLSTGLFEPAFDAPFIKEFFLRTALDPKALRACLQDAGFFGAIDEGEGLVSFCATEKRTHAEIDALVAAIEKTFKA